MRSIALLVGVLALSPSCATGLHVGAPPSHSGTLATPSVSGAPRPTARPPQPAAPAHCAEPLSGFRLAIHVRKGVSSSDADEVRRGVREARAYFRARVPECGPEKVTVGVLDRSKGSVAAQTHASNVPVFSHPGDVPVFRIDVFTEGSAWRRTPTGLRSIILLHEWYHVLEFSLLFCGPPRCQELRGNVPDWLLEGAAVYESLRAADALHLVSYGLVRLTQIRLAGTNHEPLSSLTKITHPGTDYSVAFAAVELLARIGGRGSLERFWRLAGSTGGWRGAFLRTFHLSVGRFSERFAAYRAAGFHG